MIKLVGKSHHLYLGSWLQKDEGQNQFLYGEVGKLLSCILYMEALRLHIPTMTIHNVSKLS